VEVKRPQDKNLNGSVEVKRPQELHRVYRFLKVERKVNRWLDQGYSWAESRLVNKQPNN